MLKKNEIIILNLFRKNVFLKANIKEISKIIKKPYPKIHKAIGELNKKRIIKIDEIGQSKVCSLSLEKEAISYLSFLSEQEALSKNILNIKKILKFKEFLDDIILVTGSYSKNKQNKNSDIDLTIITKEKPMNKQKLIENLTSLFNPIIHPIVISQKDFLNMLLDKEENYGKEIFKNNLLFRNSERYYELIKEAIENGFRN